MFKTARFEDRAFKPLAIAVIAVSDSRTLETDTGGALLKSLLEAEQRSGEGATPSSLPSALGSHGSAEGA